MSPLDEEIRTVELRISRGRDGVGALAADWGATLRNALVSGKSLLGVAALGFVLGEVLRPAKGGGATRKLGLGGMLIGLAASLLRARYGTPWALAEFALRGWHSAGGGGARDALPTTPTRRSS
jgi:hypothetical protein